MVFPPNYIGRPPFEHELLQSRKCPVNVKLLVKVMGKIQNVMKFKTADVLVYNARAEVAWSQEMGKNISVFPPQIPIAPPCCGD